MPIERILKTSEEDYKDFNEKWEENYYLVGSVEKNRLGGLDEFFDEIDVDDAYEYYHYFEDYPDHYYCAMAMLRCIEDHFEKKKEQMIGGEKNETNQL